MGRPLKKSLTFYSGLLSEIKTRIHHAQNRAARAVNTEMLRLYWDIGTMLLAQQNAAGWGAGVIPRLARDLHNELPEMKGFSERNIHYMLQFASEYPDLFSILQPPVAELPGGPDIALNAPRVTMKSTAQNQPDSILQPVVAKLEHYPNTTHASPSSPMKSDTQTTSNELAKSLVAQLPWTHNILLIHLVKDLPTRFWYMREALAHGWSRNVLALMINNQTHLRQGKAITNFPERLPPAQSDMAIQLLKDPYIFDFLTLQEPFQERDLETGLLKHVQKFLLELGQGFALVGRQYHVQVGDKDFYIDLLFYHLRLRCFIVIDLKSGDFKAEHAGKMNFYLNVLDDKLRHASDSPSIGLILCQKRERVIAEYALRGIRKPIGISQYELTRALPKQLRSSLPTIEQIEAELASKASLEKPSKSSERARRRAKPASGKRVKR